jgi:hypothetical protein
MSTTSSQPFEGLLHLEPRTLLSVVQWDGGGDGVSWHDPLNWAGDVLPGPGADVRILGEGDAIVHLQGHTMVRSILSERPVVHQGGRIHFTQEWRQRARLDLAGGDVTGRGALLLDAIADWTAGQLHGGQLRIGPEGSLHMTGNRFLDRSIINAGLLRWTDGQWVGLRGEANIVNLPSGTVEMAAAGFVRRFGAGNTIFSSGMLRLDSVGLTIDVPVVLTTAASRLEAAGAFQQLRSGLVSAGIVEIATGSVLALVGESRAQVTGTITGTGLLWLLENRSGARGLHILGGTLDMPAGQVRVDRADVVVVSDARIGMFEARLLRLRGPGSVSVEHMLMIGGALAPGGPLTVAGYFRSEGRHVHVQRPLVVDGSGLNLAHGLHLSSTLGGSGDFLLRHHLWWHSGRLDGAGRLIVLEQSEIRTVGSGVYTVAKPVENYGTIEIRLPPQAGDLVLRVDGAEIHNHWTLRIGREIDAGLLLVTGSGPSAIVNHVRMHFESVRFEGDVELDNRHRLEIISDLNIHHTRVRQIQGHVFTGGEWTVLGRTPQSSRWLLFEGAQIRVNHATIGGAEFPFYGIEGLEENHGRLHGNWSITPAGGTFTNYGVVANLRIEGNFVQAPSGQIAVTIPRFSIFYTTGPLVVTGSAMLGGTLRYSLQDRNEGPAVAAGQIIGQFAAVQIDDPHELVYEPDRVRVLRR